MQATATHVAVDGVSFAVERGEVFALLGANGAGKTTTRRGRWKAISAPAGGSRARARARPAARAPRRATARRDHAPERRLRRRADRARDRPSCGRRWAAAAGTWRPTSTRLDLARRRDVRVEQLSGGEQRRLEVALAIHGDPELLLLDEPTTGLDPESRRRTWEVVSELVAAGTTVLLTTHYLDEAEALADRVAIMRDGAIAVGGTLGEVAAGVPSRISFQAPAAPLPPELAAQRVDGRIGEIVLETRALQGDLARLLAWADGRAADARAPQRPRRLPRRRLPGGGRHEPCPDAGARRGAHPDPQPARGRDRRAAAAR